MGFWGSGPSIPSVLGSVLAWAPTVVLSTLVLAASILYSRKGSEETRRRWIRGLVLSAIAFRVLYALAATAGQYYTWTQSALTRLLLASPLRGDVPASAVVRAILSFLPERLGYFLFYSYGRFWLNALLALGSALLFYLFLKLLKRRQERFFVEGETELGLVAALVAGWPAFVLFVPLVFLSVILVSVFRLVFLREYYTTFGWPFLLAAAITLIFGNRLIEALGLTVLRI